MRCFYIALLHYRALQGRVYPLMFKEPLKLLNRHSLINRHCCQRPPELVRMHSICCMTSATGSSFLWVFLFLIFQRTASTPSYSFCFSGCFRHRNIIKHTIHLHKIQQKRARSQPFCSVLYAVPYSKNGNAFPVFQNDQTAARSLSPAYKSRRETASLRSVSLRKFL